MVKSVRKIAGRSLAAVAGLAALTGLAAASLPAAQAATAQGGLARPAVLHRAHPPVTLTHASLTSAFAEAPNGAVYYSAGARVYLAGGAATPAVVASGTVLALAANSTAVFADVGKTVTEYRRSTGAKVAAWRLVSSYRRVVWAGLYAVGSRVWAITDDNCDTCGLQYGNVYWFSAGAATVHRVSTGTAYPDFAAASPAGFYYQASVAAKGYLVRATPAGGTIRAANSYLFGPLALAGGKAELLLYHSGKHSGVYLNGYRHTSLQQVFTRRVSSSARQIAGTGIGLLLLSAPCNSYSCPTAKVSLLSTTTGATTSTLPVPDALSVLAGPAAAVLTYNGTTMSLLRLAS